MSNAILTLNAGSSSLKFAIFDGADVLSTSMRGEINNLDATPHLIARRADGAILVEKHWPAGGTEPFAFVLDTLLEFAEAHLGRDGLAAVGHRVVHGGADHIEPELITPALIGALQELTPLDPLHMPNSLSLMQAVAAARPDLIQIACFDTAFHHTLPPVATRFALPNALFAAGVRRYGFHGLSYEFIAGHLAQLSLALARGRTIVAHLGSGASLCALQGGRSIETTTGFSALDGLVMATRCGSVDPGVILYLGREGHSFADIEDMLYRRSGLLGVSGLSGDVRVLLASDDVRARDAIELFTYRIALHTGAMVSALGGLDGLVFTAGIGEHAAAIRAAVCERLAWLGIKIDLAANAAGAACISAADSKIEVRVIATDEEAMIALHTRATIRRTGPTK